MDNVGSTTKLLRYFNFMAIDLDLLQYWDSRLRSTRFKVGHTRIYRSTVPKAVVWPSLHRFTSVDVYIYSFE